MVWLHETLFLKMAITESFNVSRLMDYECTTECPDFVFSEKDCVNDILSKDPQSVSHYNTFPFQFLKAVGACCLFTVDPCRGGNA